MSVHADYTDPLAGTWTCRLCKQDFADAVDRYEDDDFICLDCGTTTCPEHGTERPCLTCQIQASED